MPCRLTKIRRGHPAATFVALCLAIPHPGGAQNERSGHPSSDWSVVQSVPVGQRIVLRTKAGRTVRGAFHSANTDSVTLQRKGRTDSFPADEVRKLSVLKPIRQNKRGWALTATAVAVTLCCFPGLRRILGSDATEGLTAAVLIIYFSAGAALLIARPQRTIYEAGADAAS